MQKQTVLSAKYLTNEILTSEKDWIVEKVRENEMNKKPKWGGMNLEEVIPMSLSLYMDL